MQLHNYSCYFYYYYFLHHKAKAYATAAKKKQNNQKPNCEKHRLNETFFSAIYFKHKNRKDFFDLPAQFKFFNNHPLIIKELFFFLFLPLKQTNKESVIHSSPNSSYLMDLEFGFYWDWIDAQANNFLAPFLPKQQLFFSLSLFLLPSNSSR
jgi:hypothetical protein